MSEQTTSERRRKASALAVALLVVLSVVAGTVALSGSVAAATDTSITPDDDDAGASDVTYTADGRVELANQDTLQYIDVHLDPTDVSDVGTDDLDVFIDGNEYTDGFTEFSASDGTVEFKLSNSQSVSDGDRVRVVVADVANPSDDFQANATLHDTGDARWQEYTDTVAIDTPPNVSYTDLEFTASSADGSDTTLNVGEDLNVSATIENTGEQNGTYNASLKRDGTVVRYKNGTIAGNSQKTVTFVTNFSSTGAYTVTVKDLAASEVTVTGPLRIAAGTAVPDSVDAGTTVNNQKIYVDVANVSQDGNTDTHYVEFPNALADGLSVNSVDANATSITASPNIVDGYDDDSVDDTVKFATSGDGGGDIDLNLTVDASVEYPDTETTYGIDARTEDSDGEIATRADVATVSTTSAPEISDYAVTNPSGRDVAVSFNASEELAEITVNVTDSSGDVEATLTASDFSGTNESGTWVYDAAATLAEDGAYDVTLTEAVDDDGNSAASDPTESVSIDTVSVAIVDGAADPSQVSPGTTVNNQEVTVTLSDVSADGNTDTHYVEFPNALADGLSINSANVNGSASIASSANLVEGFDDDGVDDTARFQTDTDAGGTVPLNVTVDVSVDYPDAEATYDVDARIEDSDGDTDEASGVATIQVGDTTAPTITDYAVTNPSDRDVAVSFNASEELADIAVAISDSSGTTVTTLTEGDFSGTNQSGTWVYDATYTVASDGEYTAALETAADDDGNDGADGESGTVTVDTTSTAIVDGEADPPEVSPETTVDNQIVTVVVADVSADGDTDTHYVEFPNALADGLSVNSVDANATSITSSPNLLEGYDDDGIDDTVKFATSADGSGDIDLKLTVDASVDYPDAETTYGIDARTVDSSGGTDTQSDVASISVSGVPCVCSYAVTNPTDRDVMVSFNTSEELTDITAVLTDDDGNTVTTLSESDFTGTSEDGKWVYDATYTVASDGEYTATLETAADDDGNDGADGESGTVTVDTTPAVVVEGSADPAQVEAGTTVNNQVVTVVVADVSADGDTDTHYVEFSNALADGLSVNSVDANATSITSSPNLLEGYDDDGVDDTVKFATSADGSGDVDLELSADVSVDYPDSAGDYDVDARTVDSETGATTQNDVATIELVDSSDGGTPDDGDSDSPDDGDSDSPDDGDSDSPDDGDSDSPDDGDSDSPDDGDSDSPDDGDSEQPSSGDIDWGDFIDDPEDSESIGSPPTVTAFNVTADGYDVDVRVTTDSAVDQLAVDVDGTVDATLTQSAFTSSQRDGAHVYTANISEATAGTFEATLETAADGSGDGADGQTDTITLELPDVETNAVASPPWVDDGDSTHTHVVTVPRVASVANETLETVTVEYSDRFIAESGSVSSVSDDQNVATLAVVDENGTVKSRLGETDAVSVNVDDGAVGLDLSDVDSSRAPTVAPGDRVLVELRPVANTETPCRYDTDVSLASAAGNRSEMGATLDIRPRPGVQAVGTDVVCGADSSATFALNGSGVIESLSVASGADVCGVVSARVPADRPAVTADAPGTVLTVVNVTRPDAVEDSRAELDVVLSAETLQHNASAIVVSRYDASSEEWVRLGADVASSSGETVTLEATASETSLFAVAAVDSDQQQTDDGTATPTPEETDDATDTPTESDTDSPSASGPGFGPVLAALALLAAALVAFWYRRQ